MKYKEALDGLWQELKEPTNYDLRCIIEYVEEFIYFANLEN